MRMLLGDHASKHQIFERQGLARQGLQLDTRVFQTCVYVCYLLKVLVRIRCQTPSGLAVRRRILRPSYTIGQRIGSDVTRPSSPMDVTSLHSSQSMFQVRFSDVAQIFPPSTPFSPFQGLPPGWSSPDRGAVQKHISSFLPWCLENSKVASVVLRRVK